MTIDPWALAADCDHVLLRETDPDRKTAARHLRDFWLAFGNEQAMNHKHSPHLETDLAVVRSMSDDLIAGNDWLD